MTETKKCWLIVLFAISEGEGVSGKKGKVVSFQMQVCHKSYDYKKWSYPCGVLISSNN